MGNRENEIPAYNAYKNNTEEAREFAAMMCNQLVLVLNKISFKVIMSNQNFDSFYVTYHKLYKTMLGFGAKPRFLGNKKEYFEFLDRHFVLGRKPNGKIEAGFLKVS